MNQHNAQIGIIGLGNIGQFHADRLREHAALVGGIDTDPEKRARFAENYGVDVYDHAQTLFDAVDAVIVATPNCYHEEYVVGALEAGRDVLVEKPLAHTLESAERIADAARKSDGFCMMGFNNRFAHSVEVLKILQQAGRFGDIRHIEANYIRRRGIPGCGSWFTRKATAGGGSLIDIGVHAIDLALYLLDFPAVVEVAAAIRSDFGFRSDYASISTEYENTSSDRFDVDDSVTAFIRCDDATITLEAAWAANRPSHKTFIIRGTDAGACFDRNDDTLKLYEAGKEGTDHFMNTDVITRQNDLFKSEQEAFLQAVVRGEPPERNTVEQGLAVQQVIDAIYRSAEEERAVRLNAPRREAIKPVSSNSVEPTVPVEGLAPENRRIQ